MAHKDTQTSEAYKSVVWMVSALLPFHCSQKHNARWGIEDLIHCITALCNSNAYSESGMEELAARSGCSNPCGRWVRGAIQKVPEQKMLIGMSDGIDRTVCHLKELGMLLCPVTVAIDKHFIPRYDKTPDPHLVRSRSKNGTTLFEGYCTVQCVDESCRVQIGAAPIRKGDSKAKLVRKMLSDCKRNDVKVRRVLLDREFFSAAVIHELKQEGLSFLMPARKTPGIKKAIAQHAEGGRDSTSRYTITSESRHAESFTLVMVPRPDAKKSGLADQYLVFATNIAPGRISSDIAAVPEEYRKRWGIETGYACVEKFRPRTASTNHSMRLLCFLYPLILFNCWIIANCMLREDGSLPRCGPVVTIVLLQCFIDKIVIQWFARDRSDYYLECVR